MHGYTGMGFTGMGFGIFWYWLLGLLVLMLIIWLVTRAFNQNEGNNHSGNKSALDILKDRYARGEINKDEFNEKKHLIINS